MEQKTKTETKVQKIKSWMYLPIFILVAIMIPVLIALIVIALPFATICWIAYQIKEIAIQKSETKIQMHRDDLKLEKVSRENDNYLQLMYKVEKLKHYDTN